MPTVEELAAQLERALARIARLEGALDVAPRPREGETLSDIRQIALNTRADIAQLERAVEGLARGQARLERVVDGLPQGQARLERAMDGLITKAEANDMRTADLAQRVGAIEVRLEATEAKLATHDGHFEFMRSALTTILDRLPEPE